MRLECAVRRPNTGDIDFAAFGENSLDTVVVAGPGWQDRSKSAATRLDECPGGQAATAAVACARLGWRSRYIGAMGHDDAAKVLRAALVRESVEPVVVTREGAVTRRAVVIVDEATGDRLVFEHRDRGLDMQPGELAPSVFTQARVLLVDGSDAVQALAAARIARAAGTRTMVDVDTVGPGTTELLRSIDIVVVPEAVALEIAGAGGLGAALEAIGRETGAVAVVATMGLEGALGWCADGEVRALATRVHVVDTTGAGDAFRAGLAASWLASAGSQPDFERLIADANLLAGLSCRAVGAQTALPAKPEVPRHLWGPV